MGESVSSNFCHQLVLGDPNRKSTILAFLLMTLFITFHSGYAEFLVPQPDDVDRGGYDDYSQVSDTVCTRECKEGDPPRICYYKFVLEQYITLGGACGSCPNVVADCFKPQCVTADGFERAILTVNRRLPAPPIQVCKGDTIVADVKNQMPGLSTSIHWHGLRQLATPWMDGVPMVTQCPILEGQTFRYKFLADESGSFFWHSHDGEQKVDGIVGSMIIREPDEENVLREYYDKDLPSHVIVIEDWMHTQSTDRYPGTSTRNIGQEPESYLINGRGVQAEVLSKLHEPHTFPLSEFYVSKGLRYRFRLISAICLSCSFRITFQGHKLKAVTTDDSPIEPVDVDSVTMSAAERYDVIIEANQESGAYWIILQGLGSCSKAMQAAVLIYHDSDTKRPITDWNTAIHLDPGYMLNPRNSECTSDSLDRGICVSQLTNKIQNPDQFSGVPDEQYYMQFGFELLDPAKLHRSGVYNKYIVPGPGVQVNAYINKISNIAPPSPLLTQMRDIPPELFCSEELCHDKTVCECIHVVELPYKKLIEIIIIDPTPPDAFNLTHPFHLHGYDWYIVEQGKLELPIQTGIENLKERLSLVREVGTFLPSKDVLTVPSSGYAVARVWTDNIGCWLYHCHFAYHLTSGMSAIIKVGDTDDFLPPPSGFPKCNQFVPPIEDEYW